MGLSDYLSIHGASIILIIVCFGICISIWRKMATWQRVEAVCVNDRRQSSMFFARAEMSSNPGAAVLSLLTKRTYWAYEVDGEEYCTINPLDRKSVEDGDIGVAYVKPGNPTKAIAPHYGRIACIFFLGLLFLVVMTLLIEQDHGRL